MKKKVWFNTMQKGIANLKNHPDARVEDIIQLTNEEVAELFESGVVSEDVLSSPDDEVNMSIGYILEDCIIGDIVTQCEVEMGVAAYDSPFGVWV